MCSVFFRIGPLTIYSYGFMLALAFLAGIMVAGKRADRAGWPRGMVYDVGFYALLAAILGSRLLYVVVNISEFSRNPLEIIMIQKGGLVYFGGVICAILVTGFYLRAKGIPVLGGFDLLIPSVALGHAIGRVGCLLNGCCFGKVTNVPWAITFPASSPAYYFQVHVTHQLGRLASRSLPVHPTQIYEILGELFIFAVLIMLYRRRSFPGQCFLMYLFLYSLLRFVVEYYRGDNMPLSSLPFLAGSPLASQPLFSSFLDLTRAQNVSVLLVIGSGLCMLYLFSSNKEARTGAEKSS